jgi:hypothetical protein
MSVVFDVKLLNILGFVDDKPGIYVKLLSYYGASNKTF